MHTGKQKQMNASNQASLVNRHIRRFTGLMFPFIPWLLSDCTSDHSIFPNRTTRTMSLKLSLSSLSMSRYHIGIASLSPLSPNVDDSVSNRYLNEIPAPAKTQIVCYSGSLRAQLFQLLVNACMAWIRRRLSIRDWQRVPKSKFEPNRPSSIGIGGRTIYLLRMRTIGHMT